MTEEIVVEKVRAYILENFLYMRPGVQLGEDDSLLDRRVLDSMGVMELVQYLRQQFALPVPEADISEANLGSLRAIARYVIAARSPTAQS